MTLALVGSGEYLPSMEPVDRVLLGRLRDQPRVVCLPTAAGTEGPERIAYWSDLGVDHFSRLGAQVEALPVIDRASAQDPSLAEAIAGVNFVYLSGGKPGYLYRTLAGSRAWQAILSVLSKGGILAGCSAGAMILGEKIYGFPGWKSGFNLLPGAAIIPHFDEIPSSVIAPIRLLTGRAITLLGIEGNTALIQNQEEGSPEPEYEVLGSGGVTVWNQAGKIRYTSGRVPRWGKG